MMGSEVVARQSSCSSQIEDGTNEVLLIRWGATHNAHVDVRLGRLSPQLV